MPDHFALSWNPVNGKGEKEDMPSWDNLDFLGLREESDGVSSKKVLDGQLENLGPGN